MCVPDINEWGSNKGGCEHRCENGEGSFTCECYSGYSLQPDGKTCQGTCTLCKTAHLHVEYVMFI